MKVLKWLDNNLEQAILLSFIVWNDNRYGRADHCQICFSASLSWSEEITRYMFIISGFISASYCIKHGLSVKIDQLVGMLPGKGVHYMRLVSYLIQLLFFAYLVPFAWEICKGRNGKWTAKSGLWNSNVSDSIIHSNQFCFMLYPSDPEIYTAS